MQDFAELNNVRIIKSPQKSDFTFEKKPGIPKAAN
jgi:hypothetical protein